MRKLKSKESRIKMSITQTARRKAQSLIIFRVKKELQNFLNKDYPFIDTNKIQLSFFDIPDKYKFDYRSLVEKLKIEIRKNKK